ncbi:UNVERIFIED_CONTAM: hypothetical protein FKN15_060064 [Acipenser sinensis]
MDLQQFTKLSLRQCRGVQELRLSQKHTWRLPGPVVLGRDCEQFKDWLAAVMAPSTLLAKKEEVIGEILPFHDPVWVVYSSTARGTAYSGSDGVAGSSNAALSVGHSSSDSGAAYSGSDGVAGSSNAALSVGHSSSDSGAAYSGSDGVAGSSNAALRVGHSSSDSGAAYSGSATIAGGVGLLTSPPSL